MRAYVFLVEKYDYRVIDTDSNLKYANGCGVTFIETIEVSRTLKPYGMKEKNITNIGDVIFVNTGKSGGAFEVNSIEPLEISISDRIKNSKSMQELDSIRPEIVTDKDNFIENQKLFITVKNRLKRAKSGSFLQ